MSDRDTRFMQLAIDICRAGVAAGQTPFGACIVNADGDVLACEHNRVWQSTDPTAHAEVQAIRAACGKLGQVHLEGATIYSTTEPCPMCFSAIHWARIGRIVYAAGIADAADFGFNELRVSNADLKRMGGLSVDLSPGVLREDAVTVYREWRDAGGRVY